MCHASGVALQVKVKSLAIQPGEETLLCSLENNQMFVLSLSNSDIMKTDEMNFELFTQSFHSKGITGVDCCIRKPLVATCSTDMSVRVWNYVQKTTELVKFFPEEAHSVAFHPSGLQILVGFGDKLRLMNLLMDDIRAYKEFGIKGCRECRFSHGGSYFAAVNNNTIQIYNTYTCENVGNLRGHNGKVRAQPACPIGVRLFVLQLAT
jgi:WD40 repeat protein